MNKIMKQSMLRKIKVHLLVGIGRKFNVVASDAMAMLQVTDQFVELMDKEMVIVTENGVTIKNLNGDIISVLLIQLNLMRVILKKARTLTTC